MPKQSDKTKILQTKEREIDTNFRERQEIDKLAAKGMNAREIADELGLDIKFVGSVIIGG